MALCRDPSISDCDEVVVREGRRELNPGVGGFHDGKPSVENNGKVARSVSANALPTKPLGAADGCDMKGAVLLHRRRKLGAEEQRCRRMTERITRPEQRRKRFRAGTQAGRSRADLIDPVERVRHVG